MRVSPSLLLTALVLVACQPKADDGTPAAEPAAARSAAPTSAPAPASPPAAPAPVPAEFTGDLDARGTEPFWSLTIRHRSIVFERPDATKLSLPNDGPQAEGDAMVWAEGKLVATLRKEPCSDGMSDKAYPLSAEVNVAGQIYKGCAGPAAE